MPLRSGITRSRTGGVFKALSRQFHQRGRGPDARVVLYAHGHLHLPVRESVLRELHRAWARTGQGRSEDVQTQGQRGGPVAGAGPTGADVVRWYFYSASMPWLPCRYSDEAVAEGQRKFMGTLWNTYAFYVLYARIDGFNASEYSLEDCQLSLMDRWILSRLSTVTRAIDGFLENYRAASPRRPAKPGRLRRRAFPTGTCRGRERYWAARCPWTRRRRS